MNEPKEKSSTEAPLHHIGLERPIRLKNHRSTTIIVTDNEEVTRRPLTYTDLFEPTIPQAKDAEDDCLTPRTEDDEEVGARRESSNVTKFSTGVALPKFTEMPKLRSWKSIQNGGETDYGGSVSGEKPSSPVSKMPEFNKSISQTDKPPECPKPAWMSQTKLRRVTPASQIEKNATNSTEEVSTESDRITVEENCGSDFGRKGILATSPFLQGGKRKTWSQSGSKTLDTCRDDPTGVNKPRSQPGAEGSQKVNLPPVTDVNPAERTARASEQKPTSPEPKDEPEITINKDRKRSSSSSSSSLSKLDGKATAESIAGAQKTHLPPVTDAHPPERKAATSEQTPCSSAASNLPEINNTDERKSSSSSSSSTTSSASSSAHMKAFVVKTKNSNQVPSRAPQPPPRKVKSADGDTSAGIPHVTETSAEYQLESANISGTNAKETTNAAERQYVASYSKRISKNRRWFNLHFKKISRKRTKSVEGLNAEEQSEYHQQQALKSVNPSDNIMQGSLPDLSEVGKRKRSFPNPFKKKHMQPLEIDEDNVRQTVDTFMQLDFDVALFPSARPRSLSEDRPKTDSNDVKWKTHNSMKTNEKKKTKKETFSDSSSTKSGSQNESAQNKTNESKLHAKRTPI